MTNRQESQFARHSRPKGGVLRMYAMKNYQEREFSRTAVRPQGGVLGCTP
jgi:hypothetical protein